MIRFIPIGEFRPDAPRQGSDALDHVENLAPSFGGYRSIRQKSTRTFNLAPASNRAINGAIAHVFLEDTSDQKQRPDGVNGTPTFFRSNSSATQADLHELVDGSSPSDTEYIVSGGGETGQIVLEIPEFQTPASTANWVIRVRYRVDDHSTGTASITYTLIDATGPTTLKTATTVYSSTSDSAGWVTFTDTFTGNLSWNMDQLQIQIDTVVDAPDVNYYPTGDHSNPGAWTDELGNSTALYESIDETSTDDTDYVQSPNVTSTGSNPRYIAQTSSIEDPLAYYTDAYSPEPLFGRFRVRIPHDNMVPTYEIQDAAGVNVKSGQVTGLTNSATFSDAAYSPDYLDITQWGQFRLRLGSTITAAWKNAEGTTGTAEADRFVDYYPTYDTGPPGYWSGDFDDINDQVTSGDTIDWVGSLKASGTDYAFDFQFGDFVYSGIDYGTTLNINWRRSGGSGGAQLDVKLHDGTTTFYSTTLTTTDASLQQESIALNTTAVMSALATAANAGALWISFEGYTSQTVSVEGCWINHPEPARCEFSRAYMDVRAPARASISWVEMQVPSSSTGYIDDDVTIVAGDDTDLYTVDDTGFTDVSGTTYGGGATVIARPWHFASWGNDVIATNYVNEVQVRTDNTGNFADLIASTSKPRARFVAGVRNQLFLGHLQDDGGTVDMVWWSGVDDATDFDVSQTTQADYQRLRDTPGQITGLVGGQYATVFKRHSIYRGDYTGPPVLYNFKVVSEGVGTPYPRSIVQVGTDIYFYTGSGFAMLRDGGAPVLIGDESVSRFVTDLDFSPYALRVAEESSDVFEDLAMFGAYDPNSRLIFWFYSGPNGFMFEDDTSPATIRNVVYNDCLVYDTRTGRWSYMNLLRGKSQEDEAPNVTAALNLFKPQLSHTSWTRGMGMFGWDNGTDHGGGSGMAQTYFQFDDEAVFSSEAKTKVFAVADDRKATIRRIQPIFTPVPEDTADPSVTVIVSSGDDPLMMDNPRTETWTLQDRDGWYYGDRITGEFFEVEFEFASANDEFIREIQGYRIDYDLTGEKG